MFPEAERLCAEYFRMSVRYYPYVHLFGFRQKGLLHVMDEVIRIHGLIDFFRHLRNPDLQPIAYVWFGNGDAGEDWQEHSRLQNALNAFIAGKYGNYQNLAMWSYLRSLADILNAPAPDILEDAEPGSVRLSPNDIDFVLHDPSLQADWNKMRHSSPNDANQLQQMLSDIQKMMAAYVL